jgi:hypothetical protein
VAETQPQPTDLGGNAETSTYEPGVGQLAAALAAVQAKLPRIEKNESADAGTYSYTYADLAAVSNAVLPLLGANGLAFTSFPTANAAGKFVLRYELLHKSGERLGGEYPLGGGNAQAVGSSITYARRYSLCAVTGVAPDDDDDAAAATAGQDVAQAKQQAEADTMYAAERAHAVDAVRGAWANQYGAWDATKAEEMYQVWSKGGTVAAATPGQLRNFAAMLHTLPQADAGSEPTTTDQVAEQEAPSGGGGKMTVKQRGQLFVLLGQIGLTAKPDQLSWINKQLGREYESRTEITFDDAGVLIDALMKDGVTVLPEGGETQ